MSDGNPRYSRLSIAAFVVALVALAAAVGIALPMALESDDPTRTVPLAAEPASSPSTPAMTGDDVDADDRPISPDRRTRIAASAVAAAGGGTVADVDRSDDLGEVFEVEVMTQRGEVDVALDRRLRQVPNLRFDD